MLLNSAKGYGTHDEIKKVNEVVYPTYKEAYYATGLLEDDKEYIECIEDASHWATAEHLRELFVTLLSQKELTMPLSVWLQTWHLLAGDVQFKRRQILKRPGEQQILYDEKSDLETALHKLSVGHSMFEGWMKMNELYPAARELTERNLKGT
nr:NADH-ubiquinone oxidoreductase chain 2 [Tanacetum cinerariifolium]